jgi:hypothetical protein
VGVLVGTDGSVPEHLDIAGVADVEKPGGWRTRGCSGFGARCSPTSRSASVPETLSS